MDTKKLRQKILDLAIRGKLVPQDPNDEPASLLLERIRAEKERLIAEGKIKRPTKSKVSSSESQYQNFSPPFEIPESWQWVRLEDIAYVASGSTPSKESFVPHGIPYLKMYNLRKQKIDFQYQPQYISEEVHNGKLSRSRATAGDIIMNIVGPPLGKLAIIPTTLKECNFNQAAVMIRPFYLKDILSEYLFNYLEEMSEINCISTKGTAGQVNISLTQAQNMRISLPPEREMICINEKVRQYRSILEILDNSSNDLTDSIAKAKSKILDLAMQGKLVPQDPADEPADDMLRRINPKAKIITDNPHYPQLPDNWVLVPLEDITEYEQPQPYIVQDTSYSDMYTIPVLTAGKSFILGYTNEDFGIYENVPTIIFDDFTTDSRLVEFPFKVKSSAMKIIQVKRGLNIEYVALFMSITRLIGETHKRYWISEYSKIALPFPPLDEQKRIVKKVKALYCELDKITSDLTE